ncbi:GAF domain-containing protein [uncultured Williamsia sp.]|uniref:GAF domain-containing protein n=1 Tax=uncultured Williamsia sp. TaxID=259311 RepID=UPI0026299C9D|nr:GAF domain-containing protein [uncultured Williamsia sp.]
MDVAQPPASRRDLTRVGTSTGERRLLASWRRSAEYGVADDAVTPAFTGTHDLDSLFWSCGTEVLTDLSHTLSGEPVGLMLTDPDGVVLHRASGDSSLLGALDDVRLAPGFAYSEREVGTNGLGLALADRTPTLVRAEEHYAQNLSSFTCAAVPVIDPATGRVEGCVNLTTWSRSSPDLLLALARSAAGTTAALMGARSAGRRARPVPRGTVMRIDLPRLEPGAGTLRGLSQAWRDVVDRAERGLRGGQVVAAVGERGSGRATALAQAARRVRPRDRILSAAPPTSGDVVTWLDLWLPEVGKDHTAVIVRDVDRLPDWVAVRLADLLGRRPAGDVPVVVTAEHLEDVPMVLRSAIDAVVDMPPLRDRPDDIAPLAAHLAETARGRAVDIAPAAERALGAYDWPGNVGELADVVRSAALRGDRIDVGSLPSDVLAGGGRRLSRIEAFERGEIVRVLASGPPSMNDAARSLGMSRATLYRKITHYGITTTVGA